MNLCYNISYLTDDGLLLRKNEQNDFMYIKKYIKFLKETDLIGKITETGNLPLPLFC